MSEMDRGLIVSKIIQNIIKEEERKQEEDKLRASMPCVRTITGRTGFYYKNRKLVFL